MTLDFIDPFLENLKENNLYRHLRTIMGAQGPWVELEGQRVLNLCSNNYLGLASHPEVQRASAQAATTWGCGAGASRLICGNLHLHELLEQRLASFKGTEAALLYGSGYAANLGIISSLVQSGDYIFSDRLNHASIIDGCRLSKANIIVFDHNDMDDLETKLRSTTTSSNGQPASRKLIAVDGIFSMDGDLAPLPQLITLSEKYQAILMVDEAHATGAIGPGGRGVAAHFGLEHQVPVIMGTLSKSLGGYGAFVAGSQKLIDYLTNTSRSFIFSTALPPTVVAAALAALEILETNPSLVNKLQNNARYFREQLEMMGYNTLNSQTQIIPILVGEANVALEMSRHLLAEGVLAVAIRPPTVPAGKSRIRVTVMADHTREDLDFALDAFRKALIVLEEKVTGSSASTRSRG